MKKTLKRGKGGTSFVSVLKAVLDKGITDSDEIIKMVKKELPDYAEKKIRARLNAAIKYLGKKPSKKVKAEKQPKAEKPAKETKKEEKKEVVSPVVLELGSVTGPQAAQAKLSEALLEEKKEEGLGDIVIQ